MNRNTNIAALALFACALAATPLPGEPPLPKRRPKHEGACKGRNTRTQRWPGRSTKQRAKQSR